MNHFQSLRPAARDLDDSDIVGVMNEARDKEGIIPLWVGEGDLPTPEFIVDAANKSLADGETFYTWQRGIPDLRQALAEYHARHFGIPENSERFFVVGSGMQAIQLSLSALVSQGDEVIMTTPCWPNIHAATQLVGAKPVHVELDFTESGWSLDVDKFLGAVTQRTRAIFINSPSNPTGWIASEQVLKEILALARMRGIWIIADEVYSRFVYEDAGFPNRRSPSFYDFMNVDDRVIFVNTFSKNWAMTGWRAGWISAPPEIGQVIENLVQYSTSGVPSFTQRAAAVALREGESFLAMQIARAQSNRDLVCDAFASTGKIKFARPEGAFYLFFKVEGYPEAKALALRLIDEANVGLSPGTGFYTGGDEYLRLCFLRDPNEIQEGVNRIVTWLNDK